MPYRLATPQCSIAYIVYQISFVLASIFCPKNKFFSFSFLLPLYSVPPASRCRKSDLSPSEQNGNKIQKFYTGTRSTCCKAKQQSKRSTDPQNIVHICVRSAARQNREASKYPPLKWRLWKALKGKVTGAALKRRTKLAYRTQASRALYFFLLNFLLLLSIHCLKGS